LWYPYICTPYKVYEIINKMDIAISLISFIKIWLLLLFVPIVYPIWLPGAIIASDWLKFQKSSSPILVLHGGWNWKLSGLYMLPVYSSFGLEKFHCIIVFFRICSCFFFHRRRRSLKISANQKLLWPLAAMLDNWS
jgi:hypothetical protein